MGLLGRYFSERDLKFINSINAELMGDVIQTLVTVYKIAVNETKTNTYGETDQNSAGLLFYPGVEITALIERADPTADVDPFGPDRNQSVIFRFREKMLKDLNLYPEIGDIIFFNEKYHEIDNNVQEQLLGGQADKSHSIICHTHYSKLSKINLVNRQF